MRQLSSTLWLQLALYKHTRLIQFISTSVAYVCGWIVSSLVQVMICRMFGVKPSSKLMMTPHQSHPTEWTFNDDVIKAKIVLNSIVIFVAWHKEVIYFECRINSNLGNLETPNRQQVEWPLTNRLSYRGSRKNWTQQPVPLMSEHSTHVAWLPEYHCL